MHIQVINPNSNPGFTDSMRAGLVGLQKNLQVEISFVTLENTPFGIETQRHIDAVNDPLCAHIENANADAYVIACFADTGVMSAREITGKPVVGICEAGLTTALNAGERFGIVSILDETINAELRQIRSMGLMERFVGFAPVNVPVCNMQTDPSVPDRMMEAAHELKAKGAEVLVFGCAGMVPYRKEVAEKTNLRVVDPVVAGVTTAMALLC